MGPFDIPCHRRFPAFVDGRFQLSEMIDRRFAADLVWHQKTPLDTPHKVYRGQGLVRGYSDLEQELWAEQQFVPLFTTTRTRRRTPIHAVRSDAMVRLQRERRLDPYAAYKRCHNACEEAATRMGSWSVLADTMWKALAAKNDRVRSSTEAPFRLYLRLEAGESPFGAFGNPFVFVEELPIWALLPPLDPDVRLVIARVPRVLVQMTEAPDDPRRQLALMEGGISPNLILYRAPIHTAAPFLFGLDGVTASTAAAGVEGGIHHFLDSGHLTVSPGTRLPHIFALLGQVDRDSLLATTEEERHFIQRLDLILAAALMATTPEEFTAYVATGGRPLLA